MGSNSFGSIFRYTTWGESHGKAIGVVIDGCPSGLSITEEEINKKLDMRRGGQSPFTTPRAEADVVEILSGVFEGVTTGAPLSLIIYNKDKDSTKYEPIKDVLRPGHANFTYLKKYGVFDYRGGGRSSARETACRVAAGAIAHKLLEHIGVEIHAYIKAIGGITAKNIPDAKTLRETTYKSSIFCPDQMAEKEMITALSAAKDEGDSLGGIIECQCLHLPIGLGDPVYEKIEAMLGYAMLTLPATKGFEIGSGFHAASMRGSEHNDAFIVSDSGVVTTETNNAGGTLGGISTGTPLVFRTAFKPTSSIAKKQKSVSTTGEATTFELPEGSRHDPCVTIRAVPIVEAQAALVLADLVLKHRVNRL